jgi:hypothetical protein
MNFDAFISYANQDKAAADAACAKLEANGIRCWIAPRDVPPGTQWAAAIVDAIDRCRAMVLIFSSSANASKQIHREVQRAFEREVPVVPFRIENVVPEQALAYYMGPVHWLDALTPPLEQHLQKLVASLKPFAHSKTFGERASEARGPQAAEADNSAETDRSPRPDPRQPWQPSRWSVLAACVVGVVLVCSVGVWLRVAYWKPVSSGPPLVQSPPLPPVTPETTLLQPSPPSVQPLPATPADKVTLQTGLVGHWPLDDSTTNWTTNTTQDISGNGNTGTLVGMSALSLVPGKIAGALRFNGRNYIKSSTNLTAISSGTAYSMALWLKTASTNAGLTSVVDYSQTTTFEYIGIGYGQTSHKPFFDIIDDAGNYEFLQSGVDIEDGKWHHIVGTRKGSAYNLYIDGLNTISAINTTIGTITPNCFTIGYNCHLAGMQFYNGTLDDVRIYNRALSAQEVAQLYSMGQ